MHIAIAQPLLPGRTPLEQFEYAAALGVQGVVVSNNLKEEAVVAIAHAVERTHVRVAAIEQAQTYSLITPNAVDRELGLKKLHATLCLARDLGADGVILVPHYGRLLMPDLTPYLSSIELSTEMMHMHLRSVSDFSYALGVKLYLQPLNQYETRFLTTVEQAGKVARRIAHPHVRIAPHTFHMALEEADMVGALREYADVIGWVTLTDHNQRVPGTGLLRFDAVAAALRVGGYAGYAHIDAGFPADDHTLRASVEMLRAAGFAV
jgi:sugar phosphate isomerase/epimerase